MTKITLKKELDKDCDTVYRLYINDLYTASKYTEKEAIELYEKTVIRYKENFEEQREIIIKETEV